MGKKNTRIKLQSVCISNFESRMTETFAQKICEAPVFLDCENLPAFLKRELSESAQARSNFYDIIIRSYLSLIDDPASEILVVQKILAKSLDR
jgi:hypothetical protein